MKYLVIGSGGPGFTSQEEAVKVLKEIVPGSGISCCVSAVFSRCAIIFG